MTINTYYNTSFTDSFEHMYSQWKWKWKQLFSHIPNAKANSIQTKIINSFFNEIPHHVWKYHHDHQKKDKRDVKLNPIIYFKA